MEDYQWILMVFDDFLCWWSNRQPSPIVVGMIDHLVLTRLGSQQVSKMKTCLESHGHWKVSKSFHWKRKAIVNSWWSSFHCREGLCLTSRGCWHVLTLSHSVASRLLYWCCPWNGHRYMIYNYCTGRLFCSLGSEIGSPSWGWFKKNIRTNEWFMFLKWFPTLDEQKLSLGCLLHIFHGRRPFRLTMSHGGTPNHPSHGLAV